ncbi:HAD-like protein [Whalleya microplaca]|nr:HAD-like protein [Whalleya microplaca]
MASHKQPKVILFDIGGVCVLSPFQSILNYELSLGIPPGWINYSISKTAPNGFWHRLERGEIALGDTFYAGFNADLHDPGRWTAFYQSQKPGQSPPPVPKLDGEWLFNDMMSHSTSPDPWMYPALRALHASGKFLLAAVSNTVVFPPGHALYTADFFHGDPLRALFDVFVSSAHVGLRKPDPRIYAHTLRAVDRFAREHADEARGRAGGWRDGVRADEVVFLDDIGENLKGGRKAGFRTIKVNLGRAFEAVDELEAVTGLKLAGGHPRIPIKPKFGTKASL